MKVKYNMPKGLRMNRYYWGWRLDVIDEDGYVVNWCYAYDKKEWLHPRDIEDHPDIIYGEYRRCNSIKAFKRQVRKSNIPKGSICTLENKYVGGWNRRKDDWSEHDVVIIKA